MLASVRPYVNVVCGVDQLVGEPRRTARTKDNAGVSKSFINIFAPPACMSKLNHVTALRHELSYNGVETGFGIVKAGRQLVEETTQPLPQYLGNEVKILNQRLCVLELADVSDELADLHGVDKIPVTNLAQPGLHIGHGGP